MSYDRLERGLMVLIVPFSGVMYNQPSTLIQPKNPCSALEFNKSSPLRLQ